MTARDIDRIPRCDYEGSAYQQEFWTAARSYEDLAERIALRRLLPPRGGRIVEIGAGAGRLADLYLGYDEIYLLDYAASQLEQARARWGHDPRFRFVQGDIYALPFPDDYLDTVVTVRVLHHVRALEPALREIARITAPRGDYITEFANKRNAKAILRHLLGRGKAGENPFSHEPFEFVELNIDYHPAHIAAALVAAGFTPRTRLATSFFRLALLKRWLPAPLLARVDGWLQRVAAPLELTPSLIVQSRLPTRAAERPDSPRWRCPRCAGPLDEQEEQLPCPGCGHLYQRRDGIYRLRPDQD